MVNVLLIPIKFIFNTIATIKNFCYQIGIFQIYKFKIPIISIGNIAFGGTGKTPLVIYLCKKLKNDGYNPAVISRGYKRKSKGLVLVNNETDAEKTGDEPYLIAKQLTDVPVVVSKKREQCVEYIINNFPNVDVIIMDDGFQYQKLKRNIDIVLLNGNECSTVLREPKSSLNRADIVLKLEKKYSIWKLTNNEMVKSYPDNSVYAFCGIANGNTFFNYLESENIDIKGKTLFQDHHEYSKQSIEKLKKMIDDSKTNSIITTEKDLVKLSDNFLKNYSLYIVKLELVFEDNNFYRDVINNLNKIK